MHRRTGLIIAILFAVSGCGQDEVYDGVPGNCTESYERGFSEVCRDIYRFNSEIHSTLRREKIC